MSPARILCFDVASSWPSHFSRIAASICCPNTRSDFGIDFFVGFRNAKGGVNVVTVEVKATERLAGQRFQLKRAHFALLANSNVPGLILVIDVKRSRYYYSLANATDAAGEGEFVSFPLTEWDEVGRRDLVETLSR